MGFDESGNGREGLRVDALERAGLAVQPFAVAPGECLPIVGPSGAGKTLMLRAIADLDPNRGEIAAAGTPRSAIPAPAWRRKVAYVPAEPAWWADTVGAHFADPARLARIAPELGLPADCGDWPVARLSSGERQRLGLARALALDPRVLLLDEPTGPLDPDNVARVEALILRYLGDTACALWITHDAGQAARLNPERYLAVDQGRAHVRMRA